MCFEMKDGSRLSTESIAPFFQHRMTDTTFRSSVEIEPLENLFPTDVYLISDKVSQVGNLFLRVSPLYYPNRPITPYLYLSSPCVCLPLWTVL